MNLHRTVISMAATATATAGGMRLQMQSQLQSQPPTRSVLVVGLNGALQKRFVLPDRKALVPGNVHRAARVHLGVGGKGQDAAIALRCLMTGGPSRDDGDSDNGDSSIGTTTTTSSGATDTVLRLAQFLGTGFAGDTVYGLLRDRLGGGDDESAMDCTVRTESELRTCTSIVAADATTELVEPSGVVSESELEELLEKLAPASSTTTTTTTTARALCLMGSLPPGCPEDTYATIYSRVAGPDTVCVVDALAGIDALLGAATKGGPLLLKINASELCRLAGVAASGSEIEGIAADDLVRAVEGLLAAFGVLVRDPIGSGGVVGLAITDGKHDAYFVALSPNERGRRKDDRCEGERERERETNEDGRDGDGDDEAPRSRSRSPSRSASFRIFKLPVPDLEHGGETPRTLYPIGAGDAVAAGTVGAWTSLSESEPILPSESFRLVKEWAEAIRNDHPAMADVHAQTVAAFAFGLACGSASCLREENSVLDANDANDLFRSMTARGPLEVVSVP